MAVPSSILRVSLVAAVVLLLLTFGTGGVAARLCVEQSSTVHVSSGTLVIEHIGGGLLASPGVSLQEEYNHYPMWPEWVVRGGGSYANTDFRAVMPLWIPLLLAILATTTSWMLARRWQIPPGYCVNCGYDLTGNVTGRCPECGTIVTRLKHVGRVRVATMTLASPWVVVPLQWISLVVSPASLVGMVYAFVAAGVQVATRNWLRLVAIVALSPVCLSAFVASCDYTRGTGCLRIQKLESQKIGSVDPALRCQRVRGGNRITDLSWQAQGVYNQVLAFLIGFLGPMRSSYGGPLPGEAEAVAVAREGEVVRVDELSRDCVILSGQTLRLHRGVGSRLLLWTPWQYLQSHPKELRSFQESPEGGSIRAAFHDGCLLLRIPNSHPCQAQPGGAAEVFVIDPASGFPVACYVDNSYGRPLPARYFVPHFPEHLAGFEPPP